MWASNLSPGPIETCRLSEPEISRNVTCPGCWLAPTPRAMQNRPVAISALIDASRPKLMKYTDGVRPGTWKTRSAIITGSSAAPILRTRRTWRHTPYRHMRLNIDVSAMRLSRSRFPNHPAGSLNDWARTLRRSAGCLSKRSAEIAEQLIGGVGDGASPKSLPAKMYMTFLLVKRNLPNRTFASQRWLIVHRRLSREPKFPSDTLWKPHHIAW